MTTEAIPRKVVRRPRTNQGTWQAEKSHLTRMQILEATMQCLVELGYAQTTTEKIAQQAGVSRGAMTHHFKSRAEVLAAAAQYITERRGTEYAAAVKDLALLPGEAPSLEGMRKTVKVLQEYYAMPSFIAMQELLHGARTDQALKEIMAPLEQALDDDISDTILKHFPVWAEIPETSELLRDLMLTSLRGLAMDPVPFLVGERLERFLDLLARVGMSEFERAYAGRGGKTKKSRGGAAA